MWYRILKVVLVTVVLTAAWQAVRLLLVEPPEVAQACALNGLPWHCRLRTLVIHGFAHHLYGPISLAAALLAWVGGLSVFAVLAMLVGMAGMVLYDFQSAGLGFLLGALLLVRGKREPTIVAGNDAATDKVIEQHTQAQ